jgi:type IV secretory pathway VirJ component
MKKAPFAIILLLALTSLSLSAQETMTFGRFGAVTIYRPSGPPKHVALFVSGDGGWNQGVVDMARELTTAGALVVGVDITRYLKALDSAGDPCSYPASDFEGLSQFVQKKLQLPSYSTPILVGYSSGATLVYAVLVQAPPGTFKGALSLGFCPDLLVVKPFCKGHGLTFGPGPNGKGYNFLPDRPLESPWIALQGQVDQVCDSAATESFARKVDHSEVIMLPKVGHGYSVTKNWLPQFRAAFAKIAGGPDAPGRPAVPAESNPSAPEKSSAVSVSDLPLIEVPASGPQGDTLVVILSGDGGWTSIDKEIATVLASKGYPAVGLNSLQYFWNARTPDTAAKDLERILLHYLAVWGKQKILLIGYSYGADVLPFMANRLSADLSAKVQMTVLLGLSETVAFEFHVSEWLGGNNSNALPVLPEVKKLKGARILCFYGQDEQDSLCRKIEPGLARLIALPGAHHFSGNYTLIAERILEELGATAP